MSLFKSSAASAKPNLACEILADKVIAARASLDRKNIEIATSRPLPLGMPTPTVVEPNIKASQDLAGAISGALATVSGGRSREVIVILPDSTARILLLDFETFPEKQQDAEGVLRFRLKKALPFDADKCALSYQAHRLDNATKVLVVVTPQEVLAEYEAAFRAAGYSPGVVLPSSLAVLGAVDAGQPTLVVKGNGSSATISILNLENLLLYRSLESLLTRPEGAQELADAVYASMIFFEDNHGSTVSRILQSGSFPPDLAERLETQTGIRPLELQAPEHSGNLGSEHLPPSLLTPLAGALLN